MTNLIEARSALAAAEARAEAAYKAQRSYQRAVHEGDSMATPNDAEVKAAVAAMKEARKAAWEAEWTVETTKARRIAWNDWARAAKRSLRDEIDHESVIGYRKADLKQAIVQHGL